ncbi:hypothetical protein CI238_05285 [Colletotrichum incanum]|uniref:Uncharacterized protein n=1 Tax=Colletotrichum incanum TaxID=1573173 RepID=A0A162NCP0_COLIC|nr:hypothetical protein CI238_05285 [Colletotrichum incanum]
MCKSRLKKWEIHKNNTEKRIKNSCNGRKSLQIPCLRATRKGFLSNNRSVRTIRQGQYWTDAK